MIPAPGAYSYGAGKAALIAYGAMLSKQVAKEGIRVNTVSPGPIYFEGGPWDRIRQKAPAVLADAEAHCVIGRLGRPEDVAAAVLFLASPVSGFIVGQNLHVDGGYMEHIIFHHLADVAGRPGRSPASRCTTSSSTRVRAAT